MYVPPYPDPPQINELTDQDSTKEEDFKSWSCRRELLIPDSVYSAHYFDCEDAVVDIEMRTCVNCARIQGFVNSVMVFYLWIRGLETEHTKSLAWWHYYQGYLAVLWVLCRGGLDTKEEIFPFIYFSWHKFFFFRFKSSF